MKSSSRKYEAHLAGKTRQHTQESRLRTKEARMKQLQTDFPNISSKLSEETKNDEDKMNQVTLKVLRHYFTDIHLNFPSSHGYNVNILHTQLYVKITLELQPLTPNPEPNSTKPPCLVRRMAHRYMQILFLRWKLRLSSWGGLS